MLSYALRFVFALGPPIVYELLRRRLSEIIPLNTLIGVEIVSIGDGTAMAKLPFRAEVTNHLGTTHATAIFGLAEAASGCAMSGAFAPEVLNIRPVAASASIKFLKPAKSELTAEAVVSEASDVLRSKLASDGKVIFDVTVNVRDQASIDVSQVNVTWHVSNKDRQNASARVPAA